MNLSKRDQIIAIVAVAAVLAVALWFFVIRAQYRTLAEVQRKSEQARDKVAKAERLVKSSAQVEAALEELRDKLARVEDGMASSDLYSWSVSTFRPYAAKHGVNLTKFGKPEEGDTKLLVNFPYRSATCFMEGNAYFHSFGDFLANFENDFPYMRVQKPVLYPGAAGTEPDEKLTFTMEVIALIKPGANR